MEKEIELYCKEVIDLIEMSLYPLAGEQESKVFFLKMKGDYFRYLSEILEDNDAHHKAAEDAHEAYAFPFNILYPI